MNDFVPLLLAVESMVGMVIDLYNNNYSRAVYWFGAAIINASLTRLH